MKLVVKCRVCGDEYNLNQNFKPCFCAKCGAEDILVTDKGVSRLRAEAAMRHLDDVKPRLEKAYARYVELAGEWEYEMQILRQYKRRGVLSEDEVAPYMGVAFSAGSVSAALKEYRKRKNSHPTG